MVLSYWPTVSWGVTERVREKKRKGKHYVLVFPPFFLLQLSSWCNFFFSTGLMVFCVLFSSITAIIILYLGSVFSGWKENIHFPEIAK